MSFGRPGVTSWLRRQSPVVLAWIPLLLATALPYLVATLVPPEGTAFSGFFFYQDDQYNYLSYSQQAQDGAFLFRNKLLLESHAPGFVNAPVSAGASHADPS